MKSLAESLFDKDLTSKKLSIEKYIDNFSSDALEKLDTQERNALFDQLFESGIIYNANQLRKNPIDLTKNIIIQRRDDLRVLSNESYPVKFNFIYAIHLFNKGDQTYIATLIDHLSGKYYCWENSSFPEVDKKPTWKGKVAAFYTPSSTYSVITNEKWVENIIDGILID